MKVVEGPKDGARQNQNNLVNEKRKIVGGDIDQVQGGDDVTKVMGTNSTMTKVDSVAVVDDPKDSGGQIQVNKRRRMAGSCDTDQEKVTEMARDECICSDCGYSPCVFVQEYETITAICDENKESAYANHQM